MHPKHIAGIALIAIAVGMSVVPAPVEAASTIWSSYIPKYFLFNRTWSLNGPSVQVEYNARVVNIATGAVVPCYGQVPVGTRLRFEFVPHKYTDISWFGTGTINDSPYGDWNNNASKGSGSICVQKNMFKASNSSDPAKRMLSNVLYANFSVNPPKKTITGLPGTQCNAAGATNMNCTPTQAGALNATFNFGATYGQFWGGAHLTGSSCTTSNSPLSGGRVNVPAKKIACPINVVSAPVARPPGPPQITAGSCAAGSATAYTIVASHPDNTPIRYLLDWNGDGRTDQMVPARGYVASGAVQSVAHTWRSTGPFTAKVATQDEGGRMSAWVSHTINSCTPPTCPTCIPDDEDDEETVLDELYENINFENLPIDPTSLDASLIGRGGPPGELSLEMDPRITNTTCTATWVGRYITACQLLRQNVKVADVPTSGEEDVQPGTYEVRCVQIADGSPINATASCLRNPNIRDI